MKHLLEGRTGIKLFVREMPHLPGRASETSLGAAETSRGGVEKCHHMQPSWVIQQSKPLNSRDFEPSVIIQEEALRVLQGDCQGHRPKARKGTKG